MSDTKDPGNTEFVLPIICPHCKNELSLAMLFALLAPSKKKKPASNEAKEEEENYDPA